ncbi:hypothetical protein AB0A95_30975 [Micromonospora sp. NPDC049230]|uniref:hypothetical protein n=1 Tax=Micromonospora sp. NPDC049230 TaxID=3155502 RepID=UPI003402718D
MNTDPRTIATDLIRSAAGDIDLMGIGEHLEEHAVDDPDGTVAQELNDLIRKATVTVEWPAAEAGEPVTEPDLAAWCRKRAANHRAYEEHELPLYEDRDIALIEWAVRCLGNPRTATAVPVLRIIARQHGLVLTDPDA